MNLISHIADVASFFSQYWLILVLLALIIVMYVVSFNRRKKYNSQVKEMMDALKPGDKVKTYSGFYGTIVSIKETTDGKVVLLEMGEGNKLGYLTVDANAIYGVDNKQDIVYEQSENETHLTNFANIVQKTKTGETKTYSFEQPSKNISTITPSVKNTAETTTLKGFVGKIEKGTMLDVYLQTAINTAIAKEGDRVVAVLKNDWVYNGCVVAEQGSILEGSLTQASPAKVASRNGSVQIVFTRLVTPKGKVYELSTEEIDFKVTNEGKIQRIALKTLVWSAVGGLVGLALAAIFSGSDSLVKGAVIGASVAGGTALVSSTAERGVDAEIPSFTDLEVKLSKPLNVVLSY